MIELESKWLSKAIEGDGEAFTHLVEAYQGPVYNLCYRMLGDAYDAEDASQETFLRAYHNLRRYDPGRSFSTWILSIAAHYCIDQIRKKRYPSTSLDNDEIEIDPPDSQPGPEMVLLARENQNKVQALLDKLQPQDRAAVVMRYWYEFSYEEIAAALKTSVSAIKSRLHRARLDLANHWIEQTPVQTPVERKQHGKVQSPAY